MIENLDLYRDYRILVPVALMFVIIFCISFRSLGEIKAFQGPPQAILAFCVSALAIWGLDQTLIQFVVTKYTNMGVAMLVTLASVLLATWIRIAKRK